MENVAPSPSSVAIKWALIAFLVSVVITYAIQLLGLDINSPVKYISNVLFIAFLILSQKEFRDKLGGFITFGQAFLEGFLLSVFYGLMIAIFSYVYFTILSPAVWQQTLELQQKGLEAKGSMSAEQIETTMDITRKYGVIIAVVFIAILTPVFGAIISLIGAAIFKKERSVLDIDQNNNYSNPAV